MYSFAEAMDEGCRISRAVAFRLKTKVVIKPKPHTSKSPTLDTESGPQTRPFKISVGVPKQQRVTSHVAEYLPT